MKRTYLLTERKLLLLLGVFGGILWISIGIILTLAPAGNPPVTYRTPSFDIRPYQAAGLLLIGFSLANLLVHGRKPNRYSAVSRFIIIAAALIYISGRLIRNLFLQKVGWEPLLPLGFLGFIAGLYYMGLVSLKHKLVSPQYGILLLITATFLLFTNDQYLPWMAIPFGLCVIILAIGLGLNAGITIKESMSAPEVSNKE